MKNTLLKIWLFLIHDFWNRLVMLMTLLIISAVGLLFVAVIRELSRKDAIKASKKYLVTVNNVSHGVDEYSYDVTKKILVFEEDGKKHTLLNSEVTIIQQH